MNFPSAVAFRSTTAFRSSAEAPFPEDVDASDSGSPRPADSPPYEPGPAQTSGPGGSTGAEGGWGELLTAALLGSERRTPPGGSPAALLEAAAVETVRHRAGLLPARAGARLDLAPADPRPSLPAAAARRLTRLLADRSEGPGSGGGRRGTAPDLAELLPQWLAAANEHGYRAPEGQLPALLDAARARSDLRAGALEFAGPRAMWLARLNPDWRFALRHRTPRRAVPRQGASAASTGPAGPSAGGGFPAPGADANEAPSPDASPDAGGTPAGDRRPEAREQRVWEEGLFAERLALLASVRRRDRAAGLALLARTWPEESAEDRLMFLDSLRETLCDDDEEFLERALGDRSRTVRATAAELLGSLPRSAFAARMAARARTCVTPDPLAAGPRISVEAPHECDASMQRDGVVPKPPPGEGERAWWLRQLVEAAPLATWTGQFGGRGPREIVALPVADEWRRDLHSAWCRAAVRQRDAEWARALIGPPTAPPAEGSGDAARLLGVLPPPERAAWAAAFIEAHGLSDAFRVLGMCEAPWAEPLGRAVVDSLEIARDAGSYPWSFSGVLGLAERCLLPSDAPRLEPLAAVPDEPEGASPGAGAYWAEAFQRLVATLRLRGTMLAELRGDCEEHPWHEAATTACAEPSGMREGAGPA